MLDDATYFEWRAYEEIKAALEATHPKARASHFEMAKRYRDVADAIASHEERLGPTAAAGPLGFRNNLQQ